MGILAPTVIGWPRVCVKCVPVTGWEYVRLGCTSRVVSVLLAGRRAVGGSPGV